MKTLITLVTIISMLGAPSGAFAQAQTATTQVEEPRLFVKEIARGTPLSVQLRNGSRIEGTFAGESNDDLLLRLVPATAGTGLRHIRWNEVASIENGKAMDRPRCWAQDSAGVEGVRQAVASCGVGKTVDVTTASAKKLRAKIQSIDASGFTVAHGRPPVPLTITYGEVTHLKAAGWPAGAKVALVSGIVVGGSLLLFFPCVGVASQC